MRSLTIVCTSLVIYAVAASAAIAQSPLRFTVPTGPYAVGFRTVDQFDYSRSMGERYDDDGKIEQGVRPRAMQTSIWYPAAGRGTPMGWNDYAALAVRPGEFPPEEAAARRTNAERFAFARGSRDTVRIRRELGSAMQATRDAAPSKGKFPVVIYGPSFNAQSFENATLMEYLASHGYLIIATPSIGAQGGQTNNIAGFETQARDMEFLIAYARQIPEADLDQIAVMGFSWGGISDVLVALRNPQVKALVTLDGSIQYYYHRLFEKAPFVEGAPLATPALFLSGRTPPREMRASLGADSVFAYFGTVKYADGYLVRLETIGHQNFGEWYNRLNPAANPVFVFDTLTQSAGAGRIATYVRQFLDGYLKGSSSAKAWLARTPGENGFPAAEVVMQHTAAIPLPPVTVGQFANRLAERHMPIAQAPTLLRELLATDTTFRIDEQPVNAWGYRLLHAKRVEDAIGVLMMNTIMYPRSANVWDSLGEAYMTHGDKMVAIQSYEKSLELDKTNTRADEMLKKLRAPW